MDETRGQQVSVHDDAGGELHRSLLSADRVTAEDNVAVAAGAAVLGLIVAAAIGAYAWWRARSPLQDLTEPDEAEPWWPVGSEEYPRRQPQTLRG